MDTSDQCSVSTRCSFRHGQATATVITVAGGDGADGRALRILFIAHGEGTTARRLAGLFTVNGRGGADRACAVHTYI